MKLKRGLSFAALLLIVAGIACADGRYALTNSRIYRVSCQAVIRNQGGPASNLKIHFPVFATQNLPPYQELKFWRTSPASLRPDQAYATYAIPKLEHNQTINLEAEYTFTNWAIHYSLTPYYGSFEIETRFLKAEEGIEASAPEIVGLAKKIVRPNDPGLEKAKKIFSFVNNYLIYDQNDTTTHSALKTLARRHGTCQDFSLLFIALCRAAMVPARFVSGYRFDPGEVDGKEVDLDRYAHAWAEVYLPPTGWTSVEPTYVYLVNGAKTVTYDFFGNISAQDRHLFSCYTRYPQADSIWDYDPKYPAKVEIIFRNRIRGL